MYVYNIAKSITLHTRVYLKHDFYNINCQLKFKFYIAVWVSPPHFQWKFIDAHLLSQNPKNEVTII
jgi:hypothetical protein